MSGGRAPDTVFLGAGGIWVGDTAGGYVSGLAVTDGRVTALGPERAVAALAGPGTERVALDGRVVVPGFIDAHLHAIKGGMERRQCDLLAATTLADVRRLVARYAADHPEQPWVLGGGWSMDLFPRGIPHARLLDQLVPDRPALLYSRDHHTAWVNSAALRLAGIDADTPDPPGGRIDRDPDGTPCGALQERAMFLVSALLPAISAEDYLAGLAEAQRYLHSLGVVGWQDAKVLPRPADAEVYAALADRGGLTARVVGAQWWEPDGGLDQLAALRTVRAELARPGLRFDAVKLMLDGVCETHTAALLTPYVNVPEPANHGISYYRQGELDELVAALDAAGFQAHFHTVGDAAVRQALNAVAHARRVNGDSGLRHHLAHVQVVHPADLPRFRALGVGVNAQPLWARHEPQMTDLTIPHLGPERTGWQYPFGSLARSGAVLGIGSDWPVSTPDPLALLHVAVNRTPVPRDGRPPAEPPEVFLPTERLSLKAAMNAYQSGSAYLNHSEHRHGSLELGKQADTVLLDRDPFADPEQLWRASVLETRVAGRVVFAR
ncbi:amidohydrolase [Streptomyces sp. DSM 44915]|uniref:Amidohydrolase n=1 Tax=Streptomyces chisholmiae TaxID=3075540 RepID=A0ABU2JV30_9ACTN|nr:amidohydrolase [Streptomyces sp. DSM 44915]MDT0268846.1 amidohydrolase [Streptomyces sp. DSM 44915]